MTSQGRGIYHVGTCIVTPRARLVPGTSKGGRTGHMLYHAREYNDGKAGPECSMKDKSGLCNGHPISRADFIELYCGGKEPG